ncbi:hypothetical protein HK104_007410 [Borealophlyctis nickersoniae]|nr:hypothetical protein HK104_007410 [Borealophlyctis nickersoniae]
MPATDIPRDVKRRRRLSQEETRILMEVFAKFPKPNGVLRENLARRLNMNNRAVQIWFQNRRAKVKREKLEAANAAKAVKAAAAAAAAAGPGKAGGKDGESESEDGTLVGSDSEYNNSRKGREGSGERTGDESGDSGLEDVDSSVADTRVKSDKVDLSMLPDMFARSAFASGYAPSSDMVPASPTVSSFYESCSQCCSPELSPLPARRRFSATTLMGSPRIKLEHSDFDTDYDSSSGSDCEFASTSPINSFSHGSSILTSPRPALAISTSLLSDDTVSLDFDGDDQLLSATSVDSFFSFDMDFSDPGSPLDASTLFSPVDLPYTISPTALQPVEYSSSLSSAIDTSSASSRPPFGLINRGRSYSFSIPAPMSSGVGIGSPLLKRRNSAPGAALDAF